MNALPRFSAQPAPDTAHRAVAPAWHTAVVLLVLLGASVAGAVNHNLSPLGGSHGRVPGYLLVMLFEWLIVAFIWYGIGRRGMTMTDLVGGRWARPLDVLRDVGLAIAFLLVSSLVLSALGHLFKAAPNQAIRNLLPQSRNEIILFLVLALTAGFCEEVIFRGYLQRQFAALTHASVGGILLQGLAFGVGHGYQGLKYMLIIAIFGSMFGFLANWRRSLRPGMLAHALQDGIGGLMARHLLH